MYVCWLKLTTLYPQVAVELTKIPFGVMKFVKALSLEIIEGKLGYEFFISQKDNVTLNPTTDEPFIT